jgi:hypothetical protein
MLTAIQYNPNHQEVVMNPVRSFNLTVHVDEKRRVLIDLPDDVPTGEVELQVVIHTSESAPNGPLTREQVRARLIAEELSPEEERIGRMLAGDRSVEDVISEEREERLWRNLSEFFMH